MVDIASFLGLLIAVVLVVLSMILNGSTLANYFHLPSMAMVVGGSFGALMLANSVERILNLPRYINIVFRQRHYPVKEIISQIVMFSNKARREGILSLEEELEVIGEPFLKQAIQLTIDGTDPDTIKRILSQELNGQQERHELGIKLIGTWATIAPAFGMMGTLTGLISMLAHLADASAIGRGMSLALITTLYGTMLANLFLLPFKNKLQDRDFQETLYKEVIIEGVLSIQSGDNPVIVASKLITFLAPDDKDAMHNEIKSKLEYYRY